MSTVLEQVDHVVANVLSQRELSNRIHAAWQVVHGVLAYGDSFPITTSEGTRPALAYLLEGGELPGWSFSLGQPLDNGRTGLRADMDPGTFQGQGHADQWFAVLSQANLPLTQALQVHNQSFSMADLLAQVQLDVPFNHDQEWSWTLIGLTRYLPTDATWTARDGNPWSIEHLVQNELSQSLEDSACGGTHRLIGLSMALNARRAEGKPIDRVWRETETLLNRAVAVARQFQNADGSFSTNYFQRPGVSADTANVLATTGHTLEFLALTLPPEELRQPWVLRAADRLCVLLDDAGQMPLECGGLYHAVHGLVVFRERLGDS